MKKAKDVVNKRIITIGEEENFDNILKMMKQKGIGRLPVVDGEDKVLGVVTRDEMLVREEKAPIPPMIAFWDILITLPKNKTFQDKLKKMSSFKAKDLMTSDYMTCNEEDPLEEVVSEMVDGKYPYILVVEKEKLVGIITKSDLIEKCF